MPAALLVAGPGQPQRRGAVPVRDDEVAAALDSRDQRRIEFGRARNRKLAAT
jgi:hypothetical protein